MRARGAALRTSRRRGWHEFYIYVVQNSCHPSAGEAGAAVWSADSDFERLGAVMDDLEARVERR